MATTEKGHSGQGKQGNHSSGKNSSGNFANMDEQKRKETASKGGKSSHASGSKSH